MNPKIENLDIKTKAILKVIGRIGMLIYDYSCMDLNEKQKEHFSDVIHVNYMFTDVLSEGNFPSQEVVENLLGHLDNKHGDTWLDLLKEYEQIETREPEDREGL